MSLYPTLLQQARSGRFPPLVRGKLTARGIWKPSTCLKIHLTLVGVFALLLYFPPPAMCLVLSGILIGTSLLVLGIVEARRGPGSDRCASY